MQDPLFQLVDACYQAIPKVLEKQGKVRDLGEIGGMFWGGGFRVQDVGFGGLLGFRVLGVGLQDVLSPEP